MITLYGSVAGFGLPEVSPYVTKTDIQLRMAGLTFDKAPAMPVQSPKGQLPFIEDDGETIADSTFIRAHIERKYGVDLDAGLDEAERARAWAVERMVENHLGWAVSWQQFMRPENFERGPARFFDGEENEARRAELVKNMRIQVAFTFRSVGVGRHGPDEITWLGVRSLESLSAMIGDGLYLTGDRPCGADATIFAILAGLLTPFFDSPLRREAEKFPLLTGYVARMMARYYPDHPWEARNEKERRDAA